MWAKDSVTGETSRLFRSAEEIDPGLAVEPRLLPTLCNRAVRAEKFDRDTLFKNMASGKISLFRDFPSPLKSARHGSTRHPLISPSDRILAAFYNAGIKDRIRTQSGKKGAWKYFTVSELADKWRRNKALINVTDFHFRGTLLESVIDPNPLSRFNLYPACPQQTSWLEMMTLVVSTRGAFSDSHSDDSDGSNHCFIGRKLWLAWDTQEGIAAGLQDFDRQKIKHRCAFDMETFLSLPSARWFTVESGQTLFMPGHLTHKVLTLGPYLGVGSFYLAYPNFLRTLSRWLAHPPNWENLERKGYRDLVYPELIATAVNKLRSLDRTSRASNLRWGRDYLDDSIKTWNQVTSKAEKAQLLTILGSDQSNYLKINHYLPNIG